MNIPSRVRYIMSGLALLLFLATAAFLLKPVHPGAGEPARQVCCHNNLKRIGLALARYHECYSRFPPPITIGKGGKPLHSWRVMILPFLVEDDMFRQIRLDEPWNSPHNRDLVDSQMWLNFHCPSEQQATETTSQHATSYVMVADRPAGADGLKDSGDSQTDTSRDKIIVIEVRDSGIHWAEPRDLYLDEISLQINGKDGKGIASHHIGGAFVLFGDGRVEFLNDSTDPKVLAKWLGLPEKKSAE